MSDLSNLFGVDFSYLTNLKSTIESAKKKIIMGNNVFLGISLIIVFSIILILVGVFNKHSLEDSENDSMNDTYYEKCRKKERRRIATGMIKAGLFILLLLGIFMTTFFCISKKKIENIF